METVNAILVVVLGPAFWLMLGAFIGAGVVAFLWLYNIEKPWRPTDEEAVEAWEIVTGRDARESGKYYESIRVALAWAAGWRKALGEKNDGTAKKKIDK
jgi:hypothetical protein